MIKKLTWGHYIMFLFLFTISTLCHAQTVKLLQQGQPCSIRGLSVVNDRVAWVSGSNGYVGLTTDAGETWAWQQVKGFEKSDFRDIEAFSDKRAIIMSSGTPALILQTTDGGLTWQTNYRNNDKAYFLDGMDFVDSKHGYAFGDPIDDKFVILETADGGTTWMQSTNAPVALPAEAAFAASGTSINLDAAKQLTFVTGGPVSRLFKKRNNTWQAQTLALAQGRDSKGAFAMAAGGKFSVMVGGDYRQPGNRDSAACYYDKTSQSYQLSKVMPGGFQSGVCWLGKGDFLATGTSGTNITTNGGINWAQIDTLSFNVCKQAKHGKLVLLAGDKGRIGRLEAYMPHN